MTIVKVGINNFARACETAKSRAPPPTLQMRFIYEQNSIRVQALIAWRCCSKAIVMQPTRFKEEERDGKQVGAQGRPRPHSVIA
jgi:hypothetical protein